MAIRPIQSAQENLPLISEEVKKEIRRNIDKFDGAQLPKIEYRSDIKAADVMSLAALGYGLIANSGPIVHGVVAAQQADRPNVERENHQMAKNQDRRRTEIQMQRPTLEGLNRQDSLDLSREIINNLQNNLPFATTQALIREADVFMHLEHRGNAVKEAALLGKNEELALLIEGAVSNEDLTETLLHLVRRENLPGVQILLQHNHPISIEQYGEVVVRAAKLNYTAILQLLIQKKQISDEDRGQAIIEAVENSSEEALDLLLQNGPISQNKRGMATLIACKRSLAFLQKILSSGTISLQHRGEATIEAVKNGNYDHMRLCIGGIDKIFEEHRGLAAIEAMKNGESNIIAQLLANGSIGELHRRQIAQLTHIRRQ